MIPTLNGRIQTRIFLVLFIGIPWTLIITPFLPNNRDLIPGSSLVDTYKTTFTVLGIVLAVALIVWEWLYHLLQQFRWEKDWPVMFSLFLVIPEAIVAKLIFNALDIGAKFNATATEATFWWHIGTTWLVMWLFVLGPIKIFFVRWRFNGGRIFF